MSRRRANPPLLVATSRHIPPPFFATSRQIGATSRQNVQNTCPFGLPTSACAAINMETHPGGAGGARRAQAATGMGPDGESLASDHCADSTVCHIRRTLKKHHPRAGNGRQGAAHRQERRMGSWLAGVAWHMKIRVSKTKMQRTGGLAHETRGSGNRFRRRGVAWHLKKNGTGTL